MENINELNPQRQKKAKEYAKINRRFMILDLIIGIAFLLAWLLFDWSMELRNWTLILTTNNWLGIAAFGAVFGAAFYVINLPLSYYTGYIIPHRYEMSNQTIRGWLEDQVKSLLISIILGGLLLEIIYAVLRAAPETWWLWVGGIMLLFNVVLANLAPVLIFPLFYDFSPLGEEHADLAARLVQLAEQAGTHIKGVFKFDMSRRSKAANAGLTGLGSTRRIILGDTLLDEFSADEIETILAHELGHHVNKDIPIGMAIQTALTLGGLYLASLVLDWGVGYFGFYSVADIAALPLFGLVMGAYGLVTMPLGNGYSRWRERLADAYALKVTGKGEAYASALTRLADQNLADADPELWIEWLLHSHPALSKRIAMAKSNQKR
ncbi:MAG: M48 family metallopeptidase [Chloroflexota bacterium]|nr:M48 family metallopeptidase [Chloroflexota bacterium]